MFGYECVTEFKVVCFVNCILRHALVCNTKNLRYLCDPCDSSLIIDNTFRVRSKTKAIVVSPTSSLVSKKMCVVSYYVFQKQRAPDE